MRGLSFLVFILSGSLWAQNQSELKIQKPLTFSNKCTLGDEVTISAVGDILLHLPLQNQAFKNDFAFQSLWPAMIPIFNQFDTSYANFEGPSAEGITTAGKKGLEGFKPYADIYTGYPAFNYHPLLIKNILDSGIDVVSTANNHSLDRRQIGADMTIEAMKKQGLRYTGTKLSTMKNQDWHTITDAKGIKIAWLACTFSTNGIVDKVNQVLMCYQDRQKILSLIKSLTQDQTISAIIVTPHWGDEYSHSPRSQEIEFAQQLIDAGALAVLGTHPHVIQPWKKYESALSGKEGLIVFSSGNFVSGQFQRVNTQVGLMVGLKLVLDIPSGQLSIKSARYLPLLMKRYPYRVEPVIKDELVATQYSSIWNSLYPKQNRIEDIENMFPAECP